MWGAPPPDQSTCYYEPLDYMRMEDPPRARRFTPEMLDAPKVRPDFLWSPQQVRLDRRKATTPWDTTPSPSCRGATRPTRW